MAEDLSPTAYAFFGSGEVDPANVAPLLNDELPQDYDDKHPGIGALFRPTEVPRQQAGLGHVVTWLEGEFGKRFIGATDDVVAALLDQREKHGQKVVLVVVWPDEPTAEEIDTAKRAVAAGIRVKNISAALNDLDLTPYEEQPDVQEAPAEAVPAATQIAQAILGDGDNSTADAFLLAARAFVGDVVQDYLVSRGIIVVDADKSPQAPRAEEADGDGPPFDGPYKDGKADGDVARHKFYVTEDETKPPVYRPAKGRPGGGEKRVTLTDSEVRDITDKGLIDERPPSQRK